MNATPGLRLACFCENYIVGADDRLSIIRMVDTITIAREATTLERLNLFLVVLLQADGLRGEFTLSIVRENPDSRHVMEHVEHVVRTADKDVRVMMRPELTCAAPEGLYWFDVRWDGETLTKIPLHVVRR